MAQKLVRRPLYYTTLRELDPRIGVVWEKLVHSDLDWYRVVSDERYHLFICIRNLHSTSCRLPQTAVYSGDLLPTHDGIKLTIGNLPRPNCPRTNVLVIPIVVKMVQLSV
eukprot:2699446-Rhodomonas_salina.7